MKNELDFARGHEAMQAEAKQYHYDILTPKWEKWYTRRKAMRMKFMQTLVEDAIDASTSITTLVRGYARICTRKHSRTRTSANTQVRSLACATPPEQTLDRSGEGRRFDTREKT